jgi:hypothetical protein
MNDCCASKSDNGKGYDLAVIGVGSARMTRKSSHEQLLLRASAQTKGLRSRRRSMSSPKPFYDGRGFQAGCPDFR